MMVLKFYGITRKGADVDVSRIRNLSDSLVSKLTAEHPVAFGKLKDTDEPIFCVVARDSADALNKWEKYMEDTKRKFIRWRKGY